MKFGLPISVLIHGLALWGGIGLHKTTVLIQDEPVIALKIVSVSEFTNIAATRKKPIETPKPEPELEMPESEIPESEIKASETTEPKPVEQQASIEEEKTPSLNDEAKDETKDEPAKPAPKPFNLDDFSKMIQEVRRSDPGASEQTLLKGETGRGQVRIDEVDQNGAGAGTAMTVSTQDYIRTKMKPCWKVDKGAKNYANLRVEVTMDLDALGGIIDVRVNNSARIIASGHEGWRAARENVVAALHECAPYDGLLAQNRSQWKTLKLNFQPGTEE